MAGYAYRNAYAIGDSGLSVIGMLSSSLERRSGRHAVVANWS